LPIGISLAGSVLGRYYYYAWFDHMSLLTCLAGLALLIGGWPMLRWSWPAVAFLIFMIPLPDRFAVAMSGPMQTFATNASVLLLQVMGQPALAEGNVILLNEVELGIVEACSGLRMLVVFIALATAVALLVRKPIWEKILIAASALPIALLSNVLRITLTALLYEVLDDEFAKIFSHDLAGWLMMPMGLALLGLELVLLGQLFLEGGAASVNPTALAAGRRWWQIPYRITRKKPTTPTLPPASHRRGTLAKR
jgi:exosortase